MKGVSIPPGIIRKLDAIFNFAFCCFVLFLSWVGLWAFEIHHGYYVQHGNLEDSRLTSGYFFGVALCLLPSLALWIGGAKGRVNSMLQLAVVTALLFGLLFDLTNIFILGWLYLIMCVVLIHRLKAHSKQASSIAPDSP